MSMLIICIEKCQTFFLDSGMLKILQNKDTENDKGYANFYIIKRLEAVLQCKLI